jgi:archaellum component FlaG (FlaF/FlaG flagellin family)
MSKSETGATRFAVCIKNEDSDLLTPHMIYQVLHDGSAARSNYIRVVDNEGEDYLYPAEYFMFLSLPDELERVLV